MRCRLFAACFHLILLCAILNLTIQGAYSKHCPGYSPTPFAETQVPDCWNGINYYPRGHHFYYMLYDWFAVDTLTTGLTVREVVDRDLALLSRNGVNFIHLYLWDRVWLSSWSNNKVVDVGFNPIGQDPRQSPNNQMLALHEYLDLLAKHGHFVGIHFVSKPVINQLSCEDTEGRPCKALTVEEARMLGNSYYEWTKIFIEELSVRHRNIIAWGFIYGFGPAPGVGGAVNTWNTFFQSAYGRFHKLAKTWAPSPGLGQVAINLAPPVEALPDGYHYRWDMAKAQRQAKVLLDMGLPEPDIYMLQLFNANSQDLARDLKILTGPPVDRDSITIPASKILAVEFGNSSSLASPPYGMNVAGVGDAFAPSLTLEGQAQWLTNTLCAFQNTGVKKLGHWTLIDAHDFWEREPFKFAGAILAWNGYWGLLANDMNALPKPAFKVLFDYYLNGTLACSQPAVPVVALMADKENIFVGEPLTLTWTMTDVSYAEINQGIGQITGSLGSRTLKPIQAGPLIFVLSVFNELSDKKVSVTATVTVNVTERRRPARSRRR